MEQDKGQKRNDFRTGATYPIWYRDAQTGAGGGTGEWERTTTKDLSGGGASFELVDDAALRRSVNDLLEVQVILPPAPVFAIGKIARVFRDERGTLCAGIMFVSIAGRDKDRIVRVVLTEGLERE